MCFICDLLDEVFIQCLIEEMDPFYAFFSKPAAPGLSHQLIHIPETPGALIDINFLKAP